MTVHPGIRRVLALPALVLILFAVLPMPVASAHAFLVGSTPADGATLDTAPSEMSFQFSESVALAAMQIDLVDSHGQHFAPTDIRLADTGSAESDPAAADTEQPVEVIAALPPLPPDAYRLSWQTLSSDDLHVTSGVLVFGIGQQVTAAGAIEPTPRWDEAALRALLFLSFAGAIGGIVASQLFRRVPHTAPVSFTTERCLVAAALSAAAGLLVGLALFTDQLLADGLGPSLAEVLTGRFGIEVAVREAGFGLLLLAAVLLRCNVSERLTLVLAGGAAAMVASGTAVMGHSGAAGSATRLLADVAHVLAAAVWAGTLIVAVLVVLPLARRTGGDAVQTMLGAFGPTAAGGIAVMVVTGLYLASDAVASVDALLSTFYGWTLSLKLVLVAGIGILGLINHRRLRGAAGRGLSKRTIVAETAAAAVVLLLAAVLTSSQPAMEPQFVAASAEVFGPLQDGAAGDLQETVSVKPNLPGMNVIVVGATNTRRPAPAPVRDVLITVLGPSGQPAGPVPASALGDGHWSATLPLSGGAGTVLVVTVQRPGLPDTVSRYPWAVGAGPGQPDRPWLLTVPLGTPLRILAGLSLVLCLAGGLVLLRRHRLRRADNDPMDTGMDSAGDESPALEPQGAGAGTFR